MAYPRVAGHPDYSSGGTNKFIPEIWSGKLQVKLYDATVLAEITNNDYEGEIKNFGDKVHIRTIPSVTIRSYSMGRNLTYERPENASIELNIDQGYYWAFTVDDVAKQQADIPMMNIWSNDASEQLKLQLDTNILSYMDDNAHASNAGGSAGAITSSIDLGGTAAEILLSTTNVLEKIVDMGQILDEQNIPEDGRWILFPPWATALIKKSDLKDASLAGDTTSIMRNGRVGMIDRFTIFNTNRLATVSDGGETVTNVLFGHKLATTFATQITNTESLRAESTFGDLVRGLIVFGRKVVKTEGLGLLYARKA